MAAMTGASAQTSAVMEKGKAVVCETSGTAKCPNGHDTCRSIDAPLVIGSGTRDYPDWAQLPDKHIIECDVCHVLFIAS